MFGFGNKTTTTRTQRAPRTRRARRNPFSRTGLNGRTTKANQNAGLKGAINNPYVSSHGADSAKQQLKLNHVPRSEIPRRSFKTRIERIGIKLGLKRRHRHASRATVY